MAIVRKIIATAVAVGALTASVGVIDAHAAPVKPAKISVTPLGGGQGEWPLWR